MSDLEMIQSSGSSPAEQQVQTGQVVQADQTFDFDMDPPLELTPPPR
jgi:hypothetical protein